VARLKAEHGVTPGLAVVIVGARPGSESTASQKARQTVEVGRHSEKYDLPETAPEAELAGIGRAPQTPTQHSRHPGAAAAAQTESIQQGDPGISPYKDVDCFTAVERRQTAARPSGAGELHPARRPDAVARFRRQPQRQTRGDRRAPNLVGKPMAQLLLRENWHGDHRPFRAPRTCRAIVRQADIVVAPLPGR